MRRPRLAALLMAAAAAGGLGGCGTSEPPDLTVGGAALLQGDVLTVTRAASAKDAARVRAALATLRRDLAAAHAAGDVSAARKQQIEAVIARVSADTAALTPSPTPTPTETPTTSATRPTSSEESDPGDGDKGKENGKHKGKGKDGD